MSWATFATLSRGEPELVAGDVRTGHSADHLGLDRRSAERLDQRFRHLLLAGGVGLGGVACRADQEPRRGHAPLELGVVGDRRAVAALGGEVLRVHDGAGSSRLVLVERPRPSSSGCGELGMSGLRPTALGFGVVDIRFGLGDLGERFGDEVAGSGSASSSLRQRPARGRRGGAADGRPRMAVSSSVERRTARARCVAGGADDAGQRRPGHQDQPGDEQEHGEDVGARRSTADARPPTAPPGRRRRRGPRTPRRARSPRPRARPGPSPSVPAASASVSDAARQSDPGAHRPRGRAELASQHQRRRPPPARPARRSRSPRTRSGWPLTAPRRARRPTTEIGHAGQEDPDRDQRRGR